MSTSTKHTIVCEICGSKVSQDGTRSPRMYHPRCKQFKNHLDAATRAAREIREEMPEESRRLLRHHAFVATNRIGAILQKRDGRGRFC